MKFIPSLLTLLLTALAASAEKVPVDKLLEMARTHAAGLEQALQDTLGADNIQKGTAAAGENGEFVWAISSPSEPLLRLNDAAPVPA